MVNQQPLGHTPLFELPGDPLAQASINVPSPHQQRAVFTSSGPNNAVASNNQAPRKSAPAPIATNRVASPTSLFSPTSPTSPSARAGASGSVAPVGSIAARRRREEDVKRPTSPHITQPSIRHSISGRRPEIGSPASHRQSSLGRSEGYGVVFEVEEDDEADKGASGSSPMQRPQARRGAMRLSRRRPKLRRKPKPPSLSARIACFTKATIWALSHPGDACQAGHEDLRARLKAVDSAFRDKQGRRTLRPEWIGAYVPLLIWLVVSLSSTFTVLIWHTKVFRALDHLARTLQGLGLSGRLILGGLIFLTTFPPLPLYSTLIVISGFSFGLVQGFVISYIAALAGAITVFLLSRTFLKTWMVGLLNKSGGLRKVVRAIEKQPKLLFLVRLAPYPYNLMNTLLASSPTLTLKTYTLCTAVALPKLLVHTGLGTTIKNFAAYNGAGTAAPVNATAIAVNGTSAIGAAANVTLMTNTTAPANTGASHTAETIKHVAGFVGVGLCIGIFFYLFSVASAAVDELDDETEGAQLRAAGEYDALAMEDEDDVDYTDEEDNTEPKRSADDADVDEQPLDAVAVAVDNHLPMSELHESSASSPWLQRPSTQLPPRQLNAQRAEGAGHLASNSSASTLISDLEASSDGQSSDARISSSSQPHHKLVYASFDEQPVSQISLAESIGAFEDHADAAYLHSQQRHNEPIVHVVRDHMGYQNPSAHYR
ncbi:Predicted membrane protein [Ceraceosorus bombacis]|uniref:Golgi apparatus membrane protein TVP38 n=1 Tax=Ceraceosorus bombacis TaxID=401625 RepID=A0A0P1BQH8_9BASI|nr:Predicted membrane protein [Ceraceosorus bombacis]